MALLSPDLYYSSLLAVDLDDLEARGIRAIILDLDNTILPRDTGVLDDWARHWARDARRRFKLCIVTNNTAAYPAAIARELDVGIVSRALKPTPIGLRRAMRMLQAVPGETAVIGDQLFTDVLGGNLAGLTTVLVDPLVRYDLPHTLVLRRLTGRVMAGRRPLA